MSMDFIDLTDLQRRGLLRKAEELARLSKEGPEVIDFTDMKVNDALGNTPAQMPTHASSPAPVSDSPMDFLSSFAQVGAQNEPHVSNAQSLPTDPHAHVGMLEPKLDTILAKLEDTMFKIEILSGRLAQLEARFKA